MIMIPREGLNFEMTDENSLPFLIALFRLLVDLVFCANHKGFFIRKITVVKRKTGNHKRLCKGGRREEETGSEGGRERERLIGAAAELEKMTIEHFGARGYSREERQSSNG